ncbi:MAG: hypothetical protein U0792_21320 [Gemmataceae bacterium]
MNAIERGVIDLSATHTSGTNKLAWQEVVAEKGRVPTTGNGTNFGFFRVQSRDRQIALLTANGKQVSVWHNRRAVPPRSNWLLRPRSPTRR